MRMAQMPRAQFSHISDISFCTLQEGDTTTLDDVNGVYAGQAIYDLVKKPTSNIVNLVVGNLTFVDDPSGVALRTVELSTVRVDSPACSSGVSALGAGRCRLSKAKETDFIPVCHGSSLPGSSRDH